MEMQMTEERNAAEAAAGDFSQRLQAAASAIEAAAERLAGIGVDAAGADREVELERRLAEAEATIATLRGSGRKTAAVGSLIAREAVSFEAASLDAALEGLSIEQRIAVKAGLMRAGLLG